MKQSRHSGFTLIEVTVVVAIVALLVGGVTIGVRALARTELRNAATQLAGAMRFALDRAATSGRTYRMTLDVTAKSAVLEMSESRFVMQKDEREIRPPDQESIRASLQVSGLDVLMQHTQASFEAFSGAGYRPVRLGRAEIRTVWTPRYADPVTDGQAYLYYFPQGFGEEAVVHLGDGETIYSLVQHPLNGKVRILPYRYEIERDAGRRDDLGEAVEL